MEQLLLSLPCEIPLYNRKHEVIAHAIIDAVDAESILSYRWGLSKSHGYAWRSMGTSAKGTYVHTYMSREIMGLPRQYDGREVDHRNRNRLNNRRENLRILTQAQNLQNKPSYRGSTSQYRGVSWDCRNQKWRASVHHRGRTISIGRFSSELDARIAVVAKRKEILPFSVEAMAGVA